MKNTEISLEKKRLNTLTMDKTKEVELNQSGVAFY
jgi:hypothetical protein